MINDNIIYKENLRVGVLFSVIMHSLIFIIVYFGLPHISKKIETEELIIVEMLPVSDVSNVKTQKAKKANNSNEEDDSKKIQKAMEKKAAIDDVKQEIKHQETQESKSPPKEKEDPKEDSITKNESKPKNQESVKINDPKLQQKPAKKDKPKITKPESKQEQQNTKKDVTKKKVTTNIDGDLDSLLKTLEKASDGKNEKSKKQNTSSGDNDIAHDSKGKFNEDMPLSITEEVAIRKQIERHWNIPAGAQNLWEVKVTLYILLKPDGSLDKVSIVSKECGTSSQALCEAIADSALRAVQLASPIEGLSEDRYNAWKESNITFAPIAH